MSFPILQFGTSRFLQAHVDLFVSEALARGEAGGKIAVVQTTASPDSRRRLAFFGEGRPYRVLYAFDPVRSAFLMLGGDKTGDDRWYDRMVPKADAIYAEHLKTIKKKK